eukprot:gene24512-10114_t
MHEGNRATTLLDTKGPEIRTAMLHDHKAIDPAVGDRYTTFEGYKDENETRIGLSYDKLCQSVGPGNNILLADGSLSIRVDEVLNATELRCTVMNSKSLGERKNGNLPGVKVDIPVLTEKDIDDLQNFAAKNQMDFVAASFVQSAEDVQFIRKTLDDSGGHNMCYSSAEDVKFIRKTLDDAGGHKIKIICKIENMEGLNHFDEILAERRYHGARVPGMVIPLIRVSVAQKLMITKCNIARKFVICATQMF